MKKLISIFTAMTVLVVGCKAQNVGAPMEPAAAAGSAIQTAALQGLASAQAGDPVKMKNWFDAGNSAEDFVLKLPTATAVIANPASQVSGIALKAEAFLASIGRSKEVLAMRYDLAKAKSVKECLTLIENRCATADAAAMAEESNKGTLKFWTWMTGTGTTKQVNKENRDRAAYMAAIEKAQKAQAASTGSKI